MAKHYKTENSQPSRRSTSRNGRHSASIKPVRPSAYTRASQTGAFVGRDARKNAKPSHSKASIVLLAVGILLIVVAAGLFINAQMQYGAQDAVNKKLAAYATVSDEEDTGPVVDWAGLKAVNDDVVGWIQIPGTVVNYPVYQGTDNDEYLHTTAEGEYSLGGQIFMDYENAKPGLIDRQTILYGHHLLDGSMFTAVDDMCEQKNFDKVTTIWYATENETFELEPLFIYKTAATNGEARQTTFSSDEEFHSYLTNLLANASAQSENASSAVSAVNRVLTLATCDYNNDYGQGNGRSLLICAVKSDVATKTAATQAAE